MSSYLVASLNPPNTLPKHLPSWLFNYLHDVCRKASLAPPSRFDAEYLREQALLCLNMARQMSDLADKAHFEKQAMEYTLRAERLEGGPPDSSR